MNITNNFFRYLNTKCYGCKFILAPVASGPFYREFIDDPSVNTIFNACEFVGPSTSSRFSVGNASFYPTFDACIFYGLFDSSPVAPGISISQSKLLNCKLNLDVGANIFINCSHIDNLAIISPGDIGVTLQTPSASYFNNINLQQVTFPTFGIIDFTGGANSKVYNCQLNGVNITDNGLYFENCNITDNTGAALNLNAQVLMNHCTIFTSSLNINLNGLNPMAWLLVNLLKSQTA